jgi:hypothetical protein
MTGGVCTFVENSLKFSTVNSNSYCIDKDIELRAILLDTGNISNYTVSLYRAPTGNFMKFLNILDTVLKILYSNNSEFIICQDFNINYLVKNCKKKTLVNSSSASYNLFNIVHSPRRMHNSHISSIGNIFLTYTRMNNIFSFMNELADHDAQYVLIYDIDTVNLPPMIKNIRIINKTGIADFICHLSHETWDEVFTVNDVNSLFKAFSNNYLRIFYAAFPTVVVNSIAVLIKRIGLLRN